MVRGLQHSPFFDHVATDPGQEVFSAVCQVMNPQSRGTVTLRSADARDAPLIDPRFLTHPFDRRTAIAGMRELLRYLQAPVWKQRTVRRLGWPEDDSDAAVWVSGQAAPSTPPPLKAAPAARKG